MPILDATAVHPITLPDGTIYSDTVYLKNVIDHPRMEVGDYSYYTHSGKPEDTAGISHLILGMASASALSSENSYRLLAEATSSPAPPTIR